MFLAMRLDTIPILSMLRDRLGYLNQREQLIAENVANSDTPGFTPKDLQPFTQASRDTSGVSMRVTSAGHIAPPGGVAQPGLTTWTSQATPDSETTLDGNSVVLEEQMVKMNEARMDYDAAIGFYEKSINMIRMAARRPGA